MIAEEWYTGSILSIALGACNIMFLLSASLNEYLSPNIFKKTQALEYPALVALGIAAFVLLMSISYYIISCIYEPEANKAEQKVEELMIEEREKSFELN